MTYQLKNQHPKGIVTYLHFQAVRRKWKISQPSVLQPDFVVVRGGGDRELCPGTVDEHSLLICPQGRGGPPIKIWFQAMSILAMTTIEWQPWAPSLSQRVKPGSADSPGKYESTRDCIGKLLHHPNQLSSFCTAHTKVLKQNLQITVFLQKKKKKKH